MPRSRGSEMPQRQSPRLLRTSSSDSEPLHHRPVTERSPRLGERRSPRGSQSDPLNQKKLGSRIADLESQLGQAQDELKVLKQQLSSAEAAKKKAQEELEKKTKKPASLKQAEKPGRHLPAEIRESRKQDSGNQDPVPYGNQQETDVFEVLVEMETVESNPEIRQQTDQFVKEKKAVEVPTEQSDKPLSGDLLLERDEISLLKSKLEEKEKELEIVSKENQNLKNQLIESFSKILSAQTREEEMKSRMSELEEELKATKMNAAQLNDELKETEGAKEALESEMKKLRVQTEQWRKAADAAAAVLSGRVEMNARVPERTGSMDKYIASVFKPPPTEIHGFEGSPGLADNLDDGFGSGKRRGSGIKMFGDLWKRKNQK